jgi:iron complex transport system permease protein
MKRLVTPYLLLIPLIIIVMILSLAIGSVSIPVDILLKLLASKLGISAGASIPTIFSTIVIQLRLPRTILIALTGAALSGSGAAYQGLFRNPLADPYLIGVASGAGLGAVIAMSVHWPEQLLGMYTIPMAAFIAGVLTVVIVYALARVGKTVPTTNLLLAGVSISSFCTALTSFLMLHGHNELRRALSWLLGGSALTGWDPVLAVLPYVLCGLVGLVLLGYPLNVLQFGEEQAQQLGLNVNRTKTLIILLASLTAASAVAFAGIIGFVGLIVPHIVRLLWTSDYRKLIPYSILMGVVVLLIADIISRVVIPSQEIPLGIITALAGAPFFLWILRRSKQQAFW